MQLRADIPRAEILDWWEGERERIAQVIPERLPVLLDQVDPVSSPKCNTRPSSQ